jgi:hypothetical protein
MKVIKILVYSVGMLMVLTTSCSLPEPIDIDPPIVVILYPITGTNIAGTITVTIGASDDDKVKRVWYYLDGNLMATSASPNPQFELDVTPYADGRMHSFVAAAQDESDNVGSSAPVNVVITQNIDVEPPVVTLTDPTTGQIVQDSIKIVAVATDNMGIKEVAFFINSDSITSVSQYPYEYCWTIPSEPELPSYTVYAKAFDLSDNWSLSPVVSVTRSDLRDLTPPIVQLLNPLVGQVLSGIVDVIVDASDNVALDRIEYFVDGSRVHSITTAGLEAPFVYQWDTGGYEEQSTHNLFVKAIDQAGNEAGIPPLNFVISAAGEDDVPPTVTILYPTAAELSENTVTVQIDAEDNRGVVRAEFFIDGLLEHTDSEEPWTYTWDLSGYENNSIHSLFVKVYDAAENSGNTGVVSYTVSRVIDETPPVVTLLYPLAVAITGTVAVAADVYDENGIDRVEFYVDGVLIATDAQAPWGFSWNTTGWADGLEHTLYIKAYDTSENTGTAGPFSYTVN